MSLWNIIKMYSNSIDDDRYFELMMNNCWQMNGATTINNNKKGWKADDNGTSLQKSYDGAKTARDKNNRSDIFNVGNKTPDRSQDRSPDRSQPDNLSRGSIAIIEKCKARILERGEKGLIGLKKQFLQYDENKNGTLELDEFIKACKDFRIDATQNEIKVLFNAFDTDKSDSVDYDELMNALRGNMSSRRTDLVMKAFKRIDKDGKGVLDINDIKALYDYGGHPDVKNGRKTDDDAYCDFISGIELNHQLFGGFKDSRVSKDEFIEYYKNVSATINNDNFFEEMINGTWNLKKYAAFVDNYDNSNKRNLSKTPERNIGRSNRSTTPVRENDISGRDKSAGVSSRTPNRTPDRNNMTPTRGKTEVPWGTTENKTNYKTSSRDNANVGKSSSSTAYGGSSSGSNDSLSAIEKFRSKLAARGTRGIMGTRRSFMICDDDNSKTLSYKEFEKFCNDYRMGLSKKEITELFQYFDSDGSGEIDYEEFLKGVVGDMNNFRKGVVKRVFDKLDRDKNGTLEVSDLRGVFNAKTHPDVKSGKKTEDDILGEFLDTFEHHFSLLVNYKY